MRLASWKGLGVFPIPNYEEFLLNTPSYPKNEDIPAVENIITRHIDDCSSRTWVDNPWSLLRSEFKISVAAMKRVFDWLNSTNGNVETNQIILSIQEHVWKK